MKIPSITQIVSWHRSAMSTRADLNDCLDEAGPEEGKGIERVEQEEELPAKRRIVYPVGTENHNRLFKIKLKTSTAD